MYWQYMHVFKVQYNVHEDSTALLQSNHPQGTHETQSLMRTDTDLLSLQLQLAAQPCPYAT